MLRITTGTAKNKKLQVPKGIEGFRPVQEVVKSAIFSIVGEKVVGSTCLDLFAGSGNLGMEALSRGARWCDFVDENPEAREVILENAGLLGFKDKSRVYLKNSGKFVKGFANYLEKYDIVFMDPFYKDTKHKFLFSNLEKVIKNNAVVFFTHGEALKIADLIEGTKFEIETQRKFGATYLSVLRLRLKN